MEEVQQRVTRTLGLTLWGEAEGPAGPEGPGLARSAEEAASGAPNSSSPSTYEEVTKEPVPGSSRHDGKTRAKGHTGNQERLRLDLRKTFFTKRISMQWNRLPREVVNNHIFSYRWSCFWLEGSPPEVPSNLTYPINLWHNIRQGGVQSAVNSTYTSMWTNKLKLTE